MVGAPKRIVRMASRSPPIRGEGPDAPARSRNTNPGRYATLGTHPDWPTPSTGHVHDASRLRVERVTSAVDRGLDTDVIYLGQRIGRTGECSCGVHAFRPITIDWRRNEFSEYTFGYMLRQRLPKKVRFGRDDVRQVRAPFQGRAPRIRVPPIYRPIDHVELYNQLRLIQAVTSTHLDFNVHGCKSRVLTANTSIDIGRTGIRGCRMDWWRCISKRHCGIDM